MQIYSGPYEVEHQSGEVRRLEVTGLGIFDRDKQLVARFRKLQPHLGARKLLRYLSLPWLEKRGLQRHGDAENSDGDLDLGHSVTTVASVRVFSPIRD